MFNKNTILKKPAAIELRKKGTSIRDIEKKLKIPRSTLSGWLKEVRLSEKQKEILKAKWVAGLNNARVKAVLAHRLAKQERLEKIRQEAKEFIRNSNINNNVLEIFLAGLYLGEGFKESARTGFCNSNPKIVMAFLELLRRLYDIDESKLRGSIYGRADQDRNELVQYWSRLLSIPETQFYKTQLDKRTLNTKTYPKYKGVCAVYYHDASVERRLTAIANEIYENCLFSR